jgi:hypothetical protein
MSNITTFQWILAVFVAVLGSAGLMVNRLEPGEDWPEYNGDGGRSHYSPLAQITSENLIKLGLKTRGFLLQRRTTVQLHKLIHRMPYGPILYILCRVHVPIMHTTANRTNPLPNRERQVRLAMATA